MQCKKSSALCKAPFLKKFIENARNLPFLTESAFFFTTFWPFFSILLKNCALQRALFLRCIKKLNLSYQNNFFIKLPDMEKRSKNCSEKRFEIRGGGNNKKMGGRSYVISCDVIGTIICSPPFYTRIPFESIMPF